MSCPRVIWSSNGSNWQTTGIISYSAGGVEGVAANDELAVCWQYNNLITTTDGRTWNAYRSFGAKANNGMADLKPDYETLDIGLNLGLGFNISKFGVGAKYGIGLSDISQFIITDISIKNNVLSLYATFRL